MTALTLVHTAEVHCATFEALRDRIAPGAKLVQQVREDWLARARAGGISDALAEEISTAVAAAPGRVICSCTTIGAVAEAAGALRIDRPMMAEAARIGGRVLMVYCLDSTRDASLALLEEEIARAGAPAQIAPLFLGAFWPLFEAGETQAFVACIAAAVRDAIAMEPATCVVLAQASMAGAAALLADLGVPVLTSPEMALRAGLA
jgi:hypothetical protein